VQPPNGTVRPCQPHRGEAARHRVITAEGRDVMVTTAGEPGEFVTGAYPVEQGYLVMAYQPLHEVRSAELDAALARHEQLVRALAEAGLRVVRARRRLEAHEHAQRREAVEETALGVPTAPDSAARKPVEAPLGATA
jgi:hypothetical protein